MCTMVVETVSLEQVHDPQLVGDAWHGVGQPEVVPLGVSQSVQVRLQHQLVLKLTTGQRKRLVM